MATTATLPVQVQGLDANNLSGGRLAAWQRLQELSFPSHSDEVWRRTDPEFVRPENQKVVVPQSTYEVLPAGSQAPKGIVWGPVHEHEQAFTSKLHSVEDLKKANFFSTLNAAVFAGGTFLQVDKDVSTGDTALCVHHHFKEAGLAAPRSYLEVGAGSSVTLIEYFTADSPEILAAPSVEVHVKAGAKFRYVFVNLWNDTARVVPTVHAKD